MLPEFAQWEILHLKEKGLTDIEIADRLEISDDQLQQTYKDIFGFGGIMQDAVKHYYPTLNRQYEDLHDLPENHPYVQILRKWWQVHDEMFDKVEDMDIEEVQNALDHGKSETSIIKELHVTKKMLKLAFRYRLLKRKRGIRRF